ncbi:RNA-binding domain-containing protein [Fistulina hepatica ATCC 64428]|uniref:RNA-binding domain-containing protein n=1 Tax=Fistulina hepatica ATCC 64428 TaxID=1128425 RepID=A0A0D7ABT5_9AGAR|nr:RNA-binding domain-containing protein [Fistulina hepatica ATCC 64428]
MFTALAVPQREVVSLFTTLIGEVRFVQEVKESNGTCLKITLATRDAAKKALCMNGYTVSGVALVVTAVRVDSNDQPAHLRQTDGRRNLYVLGLPFALTKSEFAALFSKYGVVSHCVILATVDNASRRRGFVVMASHEAARRAMNALTRTQIKGHTLDISWAVVQRSQGFLDGGDRTLFLNDGQNSRSSSPDCSDRDALNFPSVNPSDSSTKSELDLSSFTISLAPTPVILVNNIPTILFSDKGDLHPLLYPFGDIKRMETLDMQGNKETISVMAEYASVDHATEALKTLRGQEYTHYRLDVQFLRSPAEMVTAPLVYSGFVSSGLPNAPPPVPFLSFLPDSFSSASSGLAVKPVYPASTLSGLVPPSATSSFSNPMHQVSRLPSVLGKGQNIHAFYAPPAVSLNPYSNCGYR